jgi:myo-inositol-1(or 4)-monophosphatase
MLKTAILAAREAGKYLLDHLNKLERDDINHKKAKDFVTEVDKNSEKMIIDIIKERFSDHDILAEESGTQSVSSDYRWIIDPLDGTTNYIHGYPMFSVSIALEYQGEVIVGVVFDPFRDELFAAEKGNGATLNDSPISTSDLREMDYALLATGFPFRQTEIIDKYLKIFREIFLKCSGIRRAGSAALDLVYVASGRLDGFWEFGLSPWDIAAGSIILKEAGGKITDFHNGTDYLASGNVIASNGYFHSEIRKAIERWNPVERFEE